MGNPKYADQAPVMCFNTAKMYQLGWYSGNQITLLANQRWNGELYGVADEVNGTVPVGGTLFVRYMGPTQDYYIGWNHKVGVESGIVEAGNQVTVISRPKGKGYAQSWLIGILDAGGIYQDSEITVAVNQINLNQSYASVSISEGLPPSPSPSHSLSPTFIIPVPQIPKPTTSSPTRKPTRSPTRSPTKAPTRSPTKAPTKCVMHKIRCNGHKDCRKICPNSAFIPYGKSRTKRCIPVS